MARCDKNCFSCIYDDCIYDDLDYEDYKLGSELDKEILKGQGKPSRVVLTPEERKAKHRAHVRARYWRLKAERLAKHTSVYACNNENVLEYWKEWRRRKLNGKKID